MKKGIDTKIINGNIGVPTRESIGETKWRKAKPNNRWVDAFTEFYLGIETEDIEYTDVTNDPAHVAFLGHPLNSK